MKFPSRRQLLGLALSLVTGFAVAQTPQSSPPPPTTSNDQPTTPPPRGEVLFQSHGEPPPTPDNSTAAALEEITPVANDPARSSFLITAYDLDARISPATSALTVRARLTVRNISSAPTTRIALQISSSMRWESATLTSHTPTVQLVVSQHLLDTDADHTGKVSEMILTVRDPLAPGDTLSLDTIYSGTIVSDATRLERIGAAPVQALDTDWDAIGNTSLSSTSDPDSDAADTAITLNTALRGFGNVLWYPVSAAPLFLGDGAKLFQAVAASRLAGALTTIRLHIAVEYHGDPPTAAYFCGRRQPFTALPDDPNAPTSTGAGIATADFPVEPLGFRTPSLFLIERPETLIAPLPEGESTSADTAAPNPAKSGVTDSPAGPKLLAVETTNDEPLARLGTTAQSIAPLLEKWLGPAPLSALTILDHAGEPFEDGPLLVAPLSSIAATTSTPALVHSLTHVWVQTGEPWFDEGLAQFMALLWTEQQQGRAAAIAQLTELLRPVALAEPAFPAPGSAVSNATVLSREKEALGEPLIGTSSDLFYRRKAAAVWWMLRDLTGDEALAEALTTRAAQPRSHDTPAAQARAFERLLEKTSGQELAWFFADWVLRDRGLPDLAIAGVEPRQLPAGKGHDSGWLVAVTVRNDGAAAADIPVVIRSGTFSTTKRIRIPGFSIATDRVLTEAPPTEVLVNDGGTPEIRTSTHTQAVTLPSSH